MLVCQYVSCPLAPSIFKVWLICCSKWKAEYTAASKQCKHHTVPLWNDLVPARTPHPWVAKRKSGAKHCVHKNHKVNNDNSYIPPATRRTKGLWRWHALCGCECRLQPVTMRSTHGISSIGKTCHTWSMWTGVPCKEGSAVQCWINPHRPSSESLWVHSNRLLTDDKPFTTYHYRHFCGYNINKCQNNSSSKCKLRQETNRKPR